MRWFKYYLDRLLGQGPVDPETYYQGDVYDSPPLLVRIMTSFACTFGAIVLAAHLYSTDQTIALVIGLGGYILAVFLIWTVPRASQTAIATVLYWGLIGYLVLFLPLD